MKQFGRLLAVLAAVSLLLLTGCRRNATSEGVINLKVWGSGEDQAMLGEMIEAFKKAHEGDGKTYNISLGVVGEDDAKTRVLEDPAAAADVFSFLDDQILDLHRAGALYEITRNKSTIWFIPEYLYTLDIDNTEAAYQAQVDYYNAFLSPLSADEAAAKRQDKGG